MPVAGPIGTPPVVVNLAAPYWQPRPPEESSTGGPEDGADESKGAGNQRGTGKGTKPKGKLKRRGRPADTDAKGDKRIFEAWNTGQYKGYADLARELGKTEKEVSLAIDRHRKRLERGERKRRTNSPDI
jgi:hypothetical protein